MSSTVWRALHLPPLWIFLITHERDVCPHCMDSETEIQSGWSYWRKQRVAGPLALLFHSLPLDVPCKAMNSLSLTWITCVVLLMNSSHPHYLPCNVGCWFLEWFSCWDVHCCRSWCRISEGLPELPVVWSVFIHQLNLSPSSLSKHLEVPLTCNCITCGGVEPWLRIIALKAVIHRQCDFTFCSVPRAALPCTLREHPYICPHSREQELFPVILTCTSSLS